MNTPVHLPPRVRVRAVELYEHAVTLRLPFRFGAATVTHAPQAFVRVEVEVDGVPSVGAAAELMVPKWFDKTPALTHEQNFEQLRAALRLAREAWLDGGDAPSVHALSLSAGDQVQARARMLGLPRLAAQFGPAQLDKAMADAVLRALGAGWCDGVRAGLLGDPWGATLALRPASHVAVRHTVGLADRLLASEPGPDPQDGLPATLQEAIAAQGLTHFKLKLCGDAARDLDRLTAIAALLDAQAGDYRVTLDGNESFADVDTLAAFWRQLCGTAALQSLRQRTLLLEQPLPRSQALNTPIHTLGLDVPVIIDESDDHDEAFEQALSLGYRGISSKACKGLFRSLHNAARIQAEPARGLLLSGEDLTCQAGLAVQQDTVLATSLGVSHIERNGHHYVNGFAGMPDVDAAAFARAHGGLYRTDPHGVHLAISDGRLDLRTLHGPGFASAVHPSWDALTPLH
jgi:L-alanine-DL-glutamate epimerase-like enolase superfamily enzyme